MCQLADPPQQHYNKKALVNKDIEKCFNRFYTVRRAVFYVHINQFFFHFIRYINKMIWNERL